MEIVCSVCSVTFEACSRAKYCSGKCKKKAWYYKHRDELSFKQRNISWTKLYRDANKNSINSKRRERFQTDLLYQKRVRNYTIQSRQSKPQNENNRLWRLNNPFKAMLKNLRKRGRRLVNEYDLYLIFQRDAGQCQYCHSYERISIDHKIPVSRGGDSSIDNLCLACLSCNSKKGTKTPEEYPSVSKFYMLVYYKNTRGVLHVANYVIYGRETGQLPSDIPFAVYEACQDALEDATYREGYLKNKLGWNLGEIAFTYGELRWYTEVTLRKIAKGLGIDESKRDTKKQLVEDIKRILEMSLRPSRQVQQTNIDYPCPWTQERGGILSWSDELYAASGIYFVEYAFDPNGVKSVGLQLNDLENVNFCLQPFQQYIRTTDIPFTRVGVATEGDFITDWIFPVGQIHSGDAAYAGPSGMITNTDSFGGQRIGKFLGPLQPDRHLVTLRGLGFSRQYTDPVTKHLIWENNPADRLLLVSEGYIKVRIHF